MAGSDNVGMKHQVFSLQADSGQGEPQTTVGIHTKTEQVLPSSLHWGEKGEVAC